MRRNVQLIGLALLTALSVTTVGVAQFVGPIHFVPVVVKAKGRAGTLWQSDVSITNLTDTEQTVTAAYAPEKHANLPPMGNVHTTNLAAHQTILVKDILGSWFPEFGDNTKGVLLVFAGQPDFGLDLEHLQEALRFRDQTEPVPVLAVSSRAYNAANPDATYGQTVPANTVSYFFGVASGKLTGIRQDQRFRTNIGVANYSPLAASVQITIYDASGQQLTRKIKTVEAFSMRQWNLKSDFGIDGVEDGLVDIRVDPAVASQDPCGTLAGKMAPLLSAYSSKNDNATGDAEFNIAQPDWREVAIECGQTPMDGCASPF